MTDGKRHAQKACFAIIKNLKPRLEAEGLSEEAVWEYVKLTHNIESRSDLSERDWVVLQARLSAAARDSHLFLSFCSEIQNIFPQCRVIRVNSDLSEKKIYEGILTDNITVRCEQHAEKSCCVVRLHTADDVRFFEPASVPAVNDEAPPLCPPNPNKPARIFEVRKRGKETRFVEIAMPDCPDLDGWAQRHANSVGHDVHITDRMGRQLLKQFSAMPACPPPAEVNGAGDVTVDGQEWLLLNAWDDADGSHWHWVKCDRTMESHVVCANDRAGAVEALVGVVGGAA